MQMSLLKEEPSRPRERCLVCLDCAEPLWQRVVYKKHYRTSIPERVVNIPEPGWIVEYICPVCGVTYPPERMPEQSDDVVWLIRWNPWDDEDLVPVMDLRDAEGKPVLHRGEAYVLVCDWYKRTYKEEPPDTMHVAWVNKADLLYMLDKVSFDSAPQWCPF